MSDRITLTAKTGPLHDRQFVFTNPGRYLIGRAADCAVRLPAEDGGELVSRHHCLLEVRPPHVRARDLGSKNGTFVNGSKIGQRNKDLTPDDADLADNPYCLLAKGDEIQVGPTVFRVGV